MVKEKYYCTLCERVSGVIGRKHPKQKNDDRVSCPKCGNFNVLKGTAILKPNILTFRCKICDIKFVSKDSIILYIKKKLTKYNKSHTLCQDQDKIQLCNICQNKIQDRIYYIMEKLEGAERNNYQAKIKHLLQEKKLTTKQKLFLLKDE